MARTTVRVPAGTCTPANLAEVARLARDGDRSALRELRRVARLLGYFGAAGGWIYLKQGEINGKPHGQPIVQGWGAFAARVAYPHYTPRYARRLQAALDAKEA